VNIRDERSVAEQVRSGLRLAGWVLLTFAVVGVTLLSEKVLLDKSTTNGHKAAGVCGLILVATLMFVSVDRWGKWFFGVLGYWTLKVVIVLLFHPSLMWLEYLLLFILMSILCARYALNDVRRSAIEKMGMVVAALALTLSLPMNSPRPLLVGVGVLALTHFSSYVFKANHRHARLSEIQ
jgi:hypothetical protein